MTLNIALHVNFLGEETISTGVNMLVSIARMWLTWGKNEDLLIPRYSGG